MNLMSRAIPLLNKLVPSALAIKGLSKIDNRLGSFIQNALASGYSTDNVLDFLRSSVQPPGDRREMQNLQAMSQSGNIHPEQERSLQNRESQEAIGKGISGFAGLAGGLAGMDQGRPSIQQPSQSNQTQLPPIPSQQTQQPQEMQQPEQAQTQQPEPPKSQQAPETRNIIQQYDDKLYAFIDNLIKQGRSPLEAGALARVDGKFEKSISKMEKDHKTNFSSIIESIYGQGQSQQGQSQGSGGIDPQLMQLMQGIRSSIQNIRGR